MSWIRESQPSWWHRFSCNVLKAGPVPKHVAFIMDGNRRFARKMGFKEVLEGHEAGFDKLAQTLEWCRDLGIEEVTVYAFSIENFKRSDAEVNGLMELARNKFKQLLDERDKIEKHRVRIRFLGSLSLLPLDIQCLAAKITLLSKDYDRHYLNVCIAYTSQDEISRAVTDIVAGVEEGLLEPQDSCETLLSRCLDTGDSPDPDLLVRTSGELRFSDFLLWQSSYSCFHFDKTLWPEFSFWQLCYAILHYQRNFECIQAFRRKRVLNLGDELSQHARGCGELLPDFADFPLEQQLRISAFLNVLHKRRWAYLTSLASCDAK